MATLAVAGLPGMAALIALFFTFQSVSATNVQLRIAEQGQITDRYNAAITNLGSRSIEVRLGGIYALQRLVQDSPRDQPSIVAVLCAFVRNRPQSSVGITKPSAAQPQTDIQAALTVVGTRNTAHDGSTTVVDLDHTQIAHARLEYLDLAHANIAGADLTGASLNFAKLSEASLASASLRGAILANANLALADLVNANLERAALVGADLDGAILIDANLTHSILWTADFASAQLFGANFTNADFEGANLTHAELRGANLTRANLTGAHLNAADFVGANLTSAKWPKNFPAPGGWVRDPRSGRLRRART